MSLQSIIDKIKSVLNYYEWNEDDYIKITVAEAKELLSVLEAEKEETKSEVSSPPKAAEGKSDHADKHWQEIYSCLAHRLNGTVEEIRGATDWLHDYFTSQFPSPEHISEEKLEKIADEMGAEEYPVTQPHNTEADHKHNLNILALRAAYIFGIKDGFRKALSMKVKDNSVSDAFKADQLKEAKK